LDTVERTFPLNGIDLLDFTGLNDDKLNLIKDYFDSIIVLRGDNVILKGDVKELEVIERVLNEMVFLQKRQGSTSVDDVKLVLDLVDQKDEDNSKTGKSLHKSEEISNIILFRKDDYIKARTKTQIEYAQRVKENDIVFAIGPAGTGKTYLAVAFAVAELKNKSVKKIVLTRPAVEAGENLGFLPGDLSEKVDPYLRPLYDALDEMLPFEKLKSYLERNIVEVIPLAYMRGRTLNNAFVILDEAQNTSDTQMKMFLTRLGANSKAIVTGDVTQIDLPKRDISGLVQIQEVLQNIDGISFVQFDKGDVVRHKLVKDIIEAYEKYQSK
jgi:phosphate starvation-inducible PhoH-like protein